MFAPDSIQVYKPAMRVIAAITKGQITTVTTTTDHNYISGTIVRLMVPQEYGMYQINKLFGPITVTSDTEFEMPIISAMFDDFAYPATPEQAAQVLPMGEIAEILLAAVRNVLND